jgi:hypothetical protein
MCIPSFSYLSSCSLLIHSDMMVVVIGLRRRFVVVLVRVVPELCNLCFVVGRVLLSGDC